MRALHLLQKAAARLERPIEPNDNGAISHSHPTVTGDQAESRECRARFIALEEVVGVTENRLGSDSPAKG